MLNLIKKCFIIAALIFLPFFSVESAERKQRKPDTYLDLLSKLNEIRNKSDFKTILNQLIGQGENINVKDGKNRTPLYFAVNKGFYDQVESLIEKGADVNARDDYHTTPLMNAARFGYEDIVKLLLDNGAEVNKKNTWGWTALINAAVVGNQNIIEQLLEKGADTSLKTNDGKTAYDIAISEGHTDAANLIENYKQIQVKSE